jgi:hypothetical protein
METVKFIDRFTLNNIWQYAFRYQRNMYHTHSNTLLVCTTIRVGNLRTTTQMSKYHKKKKDSHFLVKKSQT